MGDIFQSLPTLVVMPQSDIEDETPFKIFKNKTMLEIPFLNVQI